MSPGVAAALAELRRAPSRRSGSSLGDAERLEAYGRDESDLGAFPPDVAVLVESAEEVRTIFAIATRHRVPVVPVGGAERQVGRHPRGARRHRRLLERMNRILEISPGDLVARVEPGVITGVLQAEVEKHGLFYPPDPELARHCARSAGTWPRTRAGRARSSTA